jgi:hypothetical protein
VSTGTTAKVTGSEKDGYDHTKTKDVNESGGGRHSKDDKEDKGK